LAQGFEGLGLAPELVRAVAEEGYSEPTPVQMQAIPMILAGRDVLAGAQTGTGKTAGFTLPMLQRLEHHSHHGGKHAVRALVLTPTRELAAQVEESVRTYGKYFKLRSALVFGGVGMQPQVDALADGVDILVATPGRLLDHVGQKTVNLSHVEILVLDEADRMLDMGFIHDIRRVLAVLPPKRQNLLFSATYSDEIRELAESILHDPALVEVARRNADSELVAQRIHPVDRSLKRGLLAKLVKDGDWHQVLVFARTKHGADKVVKNLAADGIQANAIHGNKGQTQRERALAEFRTGKAPVLVATDIAARGIDVDGVTHVIQHDMPDTPEAYVHRIGRTARAGASGIAIALCSPDEREKLWQVEKLIRQELPREDRRSDVSTPMHRTGGRPDAVKPAHAHRGQPQRRPQQQHAPRRGDGHAPRGAAPSAPRGGDAPVRRPAAAAAPERKDRAWRDADFRDGGNAPAFLRRR